MDHNILLDCAGGTVALPSMPMTGRRDGGHLLVNPPRPVWERSELTPVELTHWSFLVAATGRAMLDTLPQLAGGCVNYWEAGNWALNVLAEPVGPKTPRDHRRVHLHILGRSPRASHPDWQWGESPRFPRFAESKNPSSEFDPLDPDECTAIRAQIETLLTQTYAMAKTW